MRGLTASARTSDAPGAAQTSRAPAPSTAHVRPIDATEAESEEIIALASDTGGNAWLAVTLPEQRAQLAALLDFEQMATHITNVAPLLIPGLLQSSGYARAVMRAAGVPDDEVETRVAVRMGRRDILLRAEPTNLLAIIGEGVLRRPIGGPRVMAERLDHLATMARQTTALISREAERIRRSA